MKKHIQIVAVLNIAAGVLYILAAAAVFIVMATAGTVVLTQAQNRDAQGAAGVIGIVAVALAAFLTLLGLPSIAAGWGLYRGKGWAKILTMVLAVLHLPNVPFGTALGVYGLWVLTQPEPAAPAPSNAVAMTP